MSMFISYLKYRIIEIVIWCGIPVAGAAFAGAEIFSADYLLFILALICAVGHILMLNDWGGMMKNPGEINRYRTKAMPSESMAGYLKIAARASIAGALILGYCVVGLKTIIIFGLAGFALSLLYSHPDIHLKSHLVGSKIIHYLGGQFLFYIGYLSFREEYLMSLYYSVFFALIFLGGHFIHEATGQTEDSGKVRTWSTTFGPQQTARMGWVFFILAQAYWLVLYLLNVIAWPLAVLYSIPIVIHVIFVRLNNPKVYRVCYRLMFGLCTIALMVMNI